MPLLIHHIGRCFRLRIRCYEVLRPLDDLNVKVLPVTIFTHNSPRVGKQLEGHQHFYSITLPHHHHATMEHHQHGSRLRSSARLLFYLPIHES